MEYKVTVYVMTPYHTIMEAETEEEAINIALDREGPAEYFYLSSSLEEGEWVPSGLMEFPNLGKDEKPEVEEN